MLSIHVPYSGKLLWEKTFANFVAAHESFFRENQQPHPYLIGGANQSMKVFFTNFLFSTNLWKFYPSKVSPYTVCAQALLHLLWLYNVCACSIYMCIWYSYSNKQITSLQPFFPYMAVTNIKKKQSVPPCLNFDIHVIIYALSLPLAGRYTLGSTKVIISQIINFVS